VSGMEEDRTRREVEDPLRFSAVELSIRSCRCAGGKEENSSHCPRFYLTMPPGG